MTTLQMSPHARDTGAEETYTPILSDDRQADQAGYVLDTTSDYLLETAYGPYRLTVSSGTRIMARIMALVALASHLEPMPVRFQALNDDPGACVMVQTMSLLCPQGNLTFAPCDQAFHTLTLVTHPTDRATVTLMDSATIPVRSRMDVAYMRRRLASCARTNRGQALRDGKQLSVLLHRLGDLAGDQWPSVAALACERMEVTA